MKSPAFLLYLIPLCILLMSTLLLHVKKVKCIRKTRSLSLVEKTEQINYLVEPLGYAYNPHQDIFTSHINAPQKLFGYHTFYDFAATFFNMVFDYETIYFDYRGRTWLIELWKGQYGINSGCELGIYYADQILDPADYDNTHFEAVSAKDMLTVSLELYKETPYSSLIGSHQSKHWWLTIFKLGSYSKPSELSVDVSITFPEYRMLISFLESFQKTLPDTPYVVNGYRIRFPFHESTRSYRFTRKALRFLALNSCRLLCRLFRFLTRPFTNSGDKILYLYFYLPALVKHMLKPPKYSK